MFLDKRRWVFATSQQILFRTSHDPLFHISRKGFHTSWSLHYVEYETVFCVKYEIAILDLSYQTAFISPDFVKIAFLQCLIHRLTSRKGVHQFIYFLLMNTFCCLLMHKCISISMGSNAYTSEWWCMNWFPFP